MPRPVHPFGWLFAGTLVALVACSSSASSDDDDDGGGSAVEDSGGTVDSGGSLDSGASTGGDDGGPATVSGWLSYYCQAAGECLDAWDNQVDCVEDVTDAYDETYGYCDFDEETAQACIDILSAQGDCEDYMDALTGVCDPGSVFICD